MICLLADLRRRWLPDCYPSYVMSWSWLILILAAWLPTGCTRFSPPDIQLDMAAEGMVGGLRQTNTGLTRFKCIGKMSMSGPNRSPQSFRVAMAGQFSDRLRIDMFAPFGGSAGTVSSDGKYIFLVSLPSREYYKKHLGNGSLRRIIQIDITVGDLLEMLVGRIPVHAGLFARLVPDGDVTRTNLILIDRWGKTRQQITLDASRHPVRSVWFDSVQNPVYTLTLSGEQAIDGYVLPKRIDLSTASGDRVTVALERYEVNARLDEDLFVIAPPPS